MNVTKELGKEVAVFTTAFLGMQVFKRFKQEPSYEALADYASLRKSSLAGVIDPLSKMEQPLLFHQVCALCEELIELAKTPTSNGFAANRIAYEIPRKVEELVRCACYSKKLDTSIGGLDYQRDHLEALRSICDNYVRNMLLDAPSYA